MDSKKTVFETEWFSIEEECYETNQSLEGKPFYRLVRGDGVIVLALTEAEEIILVRQYRPAINSYSIELPSGGLMTSESPLEAAKRELYEETGYTCKTLTSLGQGRIMVDRLNSRETAFYGTGAVIDRQFEASEDIEVILAKPDTVKELVLSGKFEQLTMLSLLLLADWKHGSNLTM
ncbi:NUDIX hydrolase [Candidatus Latescibacterota bacterium]